MTLLRRNLESAVNVLAEHLKGVLRLRPRHHVAGVPHDEHAQVLHRLEVASDLSVHPEARAVGGVVLVDGRPKWINQSSCAK